MERRHCRAPYLVAGADMIENAIEISCESLGLADEVECDAWKFNDIALLLPMLVDAPCGSRASEGNEVLERQRFIRTNRQRRIGFFAVGQIDLDPSVSGHEWTVAILIGPA